LLDFLEKLADPKRIPILIKNDEKNRIRIQNQKSWIENHQKVLDLRGSGSPALHFSSQSNLKLLTTWIHTSAIKLYSSAMSDSIVTQAKNLPVVDVEEDLDLSYTIWQCYGSKRIRISIQEDMDLNLKRPLLSDPVPFPIDLP